MTSASNPPTPPLPETLDDRLYEVECAIDEAILALASPDDVDRVAWVALVNRLISATMTLRTCGPRSPTLSASARRRRREWGEE